MNPKLTHALSLIFLVASGILASADRIQALTVINPQLAHLWPFFLTAATAIVNIGKLVQPPSSPQPQPPIQPKP